MLHRQSAQALRQRIVRYSTLSTPRYTNTLTAMATGRSMFWRVCQHSEGRPKRQSKPESNCTVSRECWTIVTPLSPCCPCHRATASGHGGAIAHGFHGLALTSATIRLCHVLLAPLSSQLAHRRMLSQEQPKCSGLLQRGDWPKCSLSENDVRKIAKNHAPLKKRTVERTIEITSFGVRTPFRLVLVYFTCPSSAGCL